MILQKNTPIVDPRVYIGYQGITTQSFVEANVKNGVQFTFTIEMDLAASETRYYSFNTGSNDTIIKTRLLSTDGGARYTPRRNATYTLGTLQDIIVNLNGKSSNTSNSSLYTVPIGNVTNDGERIDVVRSASGSGTAQRLSSIFDSEGIERILVPNSQYLLKFENLETKSIFIIFSLTWYEGPLSTDLIV